MSPRSGQHTQPENRDACPCKPPKALGNIGGVKTQVASQSKKAEALIAKLTKREHEIIALVADGLKNKEIAAHLSISPTTVRHHLTAIFAKLEIADRLKLIVFAFRNGLVTNEPEK